ncbi:amidohydrolase [Elizabethkingia sp. JS20170427COW]|uniref:amidohydrolase family protein n=1 Tax=Elizabethkingia sp. JS20170427COW TaxID=2583851 RepID=UPI00110FFEE8|nr:amidohydrolase family protein [Elizabethkingia sp. JS20170427COW]QCX53913.1 amidohydrolase [Elizabethkingia sp. JS20170427COW]
MIDTHVHFWEYNEIRDSWIDENMSIIRRNFLPQDIDILLTENKVDGIIAVQADQSEAETDFLLSLSRQYPKIFGIVGWVDLQDYHLEERLEKYLGSPKICGWRHIVQAEPKGFLNNPLFIKNVRILGKHDYAYGILVYHYQLPEVLEFVSQLPDQPLVLNHLGKPDLKTFEKYNWQYQIDRLAKYPNVFCKLSGLVTEAETGKWTCEMVHDYLNFVIEKFGVERVMFGSDWPVMLLNSNYSEWLNLVKEYLNKFSKSEQSLILHENAVRCYQLKI